MKDSQSRKLLEIKDTVRRLYSLQQEKKDFDKYYEKERQKYQLDISNFMFCNIKDKTFQIKLDEGMNYCDNPVSVNVTKVQRIKVVWDLKKLKQKLTKEQQKQVINKTYTVVNMAGLVEYLKSCGVDPKKFKTFIDVQESLDEAKLDNLYTTGKINREQIDDCYETEGGSSYIKITEQK